MRNMAQEEGSALMQQARHERGRKGSRVAHGRSATREWRVTMNTRTEAMAARLVTAKACGQRPAAL